MPSQYPPPPPATVYMQFDEAFGTTHYPAGEKHTVLTKRAATLCENTALTVEAHAGNFDDLCRIITADRIWKHVKLFVSPPIRWYVPYFPFARDDRRQTKEHGSELELAIELVRELDITIADPHSDVAGQLRYIPQESAVSCYRQHGLFDDSPLFAIPDAGATRKAMTWVNGSPWVQCLKKRDPATGKLSQFHCTQRDLEGSPVVIVDDICDGGGTFLGLASELKRCHAGPLTLAVTHGLFTKGTDILLQHFDRIYHFGTQTLKGPDRTIISYQELYETGERV